MAIKRKHVAISFTQDDLDKLAELQKITSLDRSKTLVILIKWAFTYLEFFKEWCEKNITSHNVHYVYTNNEDLIKCWIYTLSYDFLPHTYKRTLVSILQEAFGNVLETYIKFIDMYKMTVKTRIPIETWEAHIPED